MHASEWGESYGRVFIFRKKSKYLHTVATGYSTKLNIHIMQINIVSSSKDSAKHF